MVRSMFKAQALAIVMVVLVVASIIGVSIFSRVAKEKDSSVNQQDSAVALAEVDSILDFFVGVDATDLEGVLGAVDMKVYSDINTLSTDFEEYIGDVDALPSDNWCGGGSSESLEVTLSYMENGDYVEVQPASVMAFNLDGATADVGCSLTVNVKSVEEYAVFAIKKIMDNGGDITESFDGYCVASDTSVDCSARDIPGVEYESSLTRISSLSFDLSSEIANGTVEIRVLPIKGVLAVNTSVGDCVDREFRYIEVTAEANCNGSYRGKQMYLPATGNLGYSTLFDYGIYDSGLFQP